MAENLIRSWRIDTLPVSSSPIIIFGAGIVGEAMLQRCRRKKIAVTAFADNSAAKIGTSVAGLLVLAPAQLCKKYPEAWFLITVADIQDVVRQLEQLGHYQWTTGMALEPADWESLISAERPADFIDFAVRSCQVCHQSYLEPGKLFLRSVDVVVTERCSLRCRDCSNLMQYFTRPRNYPVAEILSAVEKLLTVVDEINDFRVIGGEPLMHRDVHLVVQQLAACRQVKRIAIYTNGTLLPRPEQLQAFCNPKTLFLITDYGSCSCRLTLLTKLLQEHHISYYVHPAAGWTACSRIARHSRPATEQERIFTDCCAKNLLTLSRARLYRCPFIANAAQLQAIPDRENDYVSLVPETPPDKLRLQLRNFISRTDAFPGCDYCDGRSWSAPTIEPAVQAPQPLPYQRYSGE